MPSPLAAARPNRLFAWPRFDQPDDLRALAQTFGAVIAKRSDTTLCLRHDARQDGAIETAVQALTGRFAEVLGADADLDVLLVDDDLDEPGWAAVAAEMTAVLQLPSSLEPRRRHRLAILQSGFGRPVAASADDLRRLLDRPTETAQLPVAAAAAPKVTAIVSTYRSAAFIRGCLEDLTSQTLYAQGQLEIIVIDSGSPENEGDIVREVQRQHPAIRYLRTERETLYAAWNRAIKLGRGTYLTNANTDDRHRPDALAVLAAELDRDPAVAVVYADQLVTRKPNETFARNTAHARFNWPAFSWAELARRCMIGPQPMWRRELHDRWGLFDAAFAVAGDYEFWLRIGRAENFRRVPEVLGLYYQNNAGLEWTSGDRTAAETLEIQRRHRQPAAGGAAPTAKPAPTPMPTPMPTPTAAPAPAIAATSPRARDKAPLVSVIMPTYNRPDFLARALDSLTQQTFTDFEVVVINDAGEPLETMLDGYADRLTITYIRQGRNRDRAAARNTGIQLARGKYLAYLDDDDCFLADHLATLVAALSDGRHQVAFSEAVLITEQKTNGHYTPGGQIMRMSLPFNRDRLLVYNDIPILCLMHERACLDEMGGFDETLGTHEDWDLLIRLAHHFNFIQVRKLTAAISWREDGTSTTSGRRDDFRRTLALIHERYRHLAAGKVDVLALQAQARAGAVVPTTSLPVVGDGDGTAATTPVERAHSLIGQAEALVERGEVGRARETLAAAVHLAPQAPELVVALADVFATEGKVDTACELLQQLTKMHPTNQQAPRRRAEIMAAASQRMDAQRAAQRVFASAALR